MTMWLPVADDSTPEVYPVPSEGLAPAHRWSQFHFLVPKGTTEFAVEVLAVPGGKDTYVVSVFDSDRKVATRLCYTGASIEAKEWRKLSVKVPRGQDGKLWQIAWSVSCPTRFRFAGKIPPYVSFSREKFFLPRGAREE